MSTTLRYSCKCSWCNCPMHRGEKCWNLEDNTFNIYIRKLLALICNKTIGSKMGVGLKVHLLSFIIKPSMSHNKIYCTDCGIIDIKITRSGRTVVKPLRLQDEIYVSGSGISGCDHYDAGYAYGVFKDHEYKSNANLRGFVVDDQSEVEYDNSSINDVDEEDTVDEWSNESSEEEYDSDQDWD